MLLIPRHMHNVTDCIANFIGDSTHLNCILYDVLKTSVVVTVAVTLLLLFIPPYEPSVVVHII